MEALFNSLTSLSHDWVTIAANGIWIGVLLTALAWIMRRYARTVNAATGYIVWWAVLALVIASPFLGSGVSALTAKLESLHSEPASLVAPTPAAEQVATTEGQSINAALSDVRIESPDESPVTFTATLAGNPDAHEQPIGAVGQPDSVEDQSLLSILARLLPVSLFALWICVASVLLVRIWLSYRHMVAIKRRSEPFDPLRYPRVDGLLRRAALRRKTELHLTEEVGSPVAAGLGRPIILIPRSMMRHLTQHELEAVVVHELAHILRWDDWTKLLQKVIEAFFFFNPVIRWIGRQLELEREVACDDRVVAQTGEPTEYARCLTRLTELATIPNASLIPGVLTGRKQIFRRFDELLSGKRRAEIRFCGLRFACAMAVVMLVAVTAVRVVPALAFPAEAVSYEEFSRTIGSLAEDIRPSKSEPVETSDCEQVCDEVQHLTLEPMRFTPGLSEPTDAIYADADDCPTVTPSDCFAAVAPESGAPTDPTPAEKERVVDWNDRIFDLPITGTIHGTEKRDGPIEVWINESQTLRTAIKGKIGYTKDFTSIRSISRDGYFAAKEEHGSVLRELDVFRGRNGDLVFNYFVDGEPQTYDKDGCRLLSRVLEEMLLDATAVLPPVPEAPGVYPSDPEIAVAPVHVDVPVLRGAVAQPSAEAVAVSVSDKDAPEPRIGREGFISRMIDWAANPFNMSGNGLMITGDDGGETSILWSDGRNKIKVKMDGEVKFTDDDRGIASISRRGYFALWERHGSKTRELTVEPGRGGDLEYKYYEDDQNRPFDDDAKEWFADILIDVIRNTGVGAEERANRILHKDGVAAVLEEIEMIDSDYVQRIYFNAILDNADLDQSEYGRILQLVGQEVDSDYEKAEILIDMADRVSENSTLVHDYVEVVATMDSDYETRRALSAVALDRNADPEVVDAVLAIATDMDSDYEKAELLISMAPHCASERTLQQSYVNAVIDVDSDYEARRILTSLVLDEDVNENVVQTVLGIVARFDSDYETAEMLINTAPYIASHENAQDTYLQAISHIDSDYERRRALMAFIKVASMTNNRVLMTLRVVEEMDSDYEKGQILKELAQYCRGISEMEDAFIDVVETLDSDYEIEKLYTYLYRRDRGSR